MNFSWISLKTDAPDGTINTEIWRANNSNFDPSKIVLMTVYLKSNDTGKLYEVEIAISVNGSYESAGYRATLFNRLMDEYNLISA